MLALAHVSDDANERCPKQTKRTAEHEIERIIESIINKNVRHQKRKKHVSESDHKRNQSISSERHIFLAFVVGDMKTIEKFSTHFKASIDALIE